MDFKSTFCLTRIKVWGEVLFGITLPADAFELWAQFFQGFGKKTWKMLSEMQIKSPEEHFWIRKAFWKQCKFMVFPGFREKTLSFDGNYFSVVVETAFFLSGNGKNFVKEIELFRKDSSFDFHSRTLSPHLSDFWQKLSAEFLKEQSSCPKGNFEVKIFHSKMKLFMNIVGHWAKKCWFSRRKNFLRKMKCFTKKFLLIHFSGLWVETFRTCGEKICGMLFKKSLLHIQRNDPRKTVLLKTDFLVKKFKFRAKTFFIMAEKIQKFYQNCILYNQKSFYRLLSKLYSTCLGNFLRKMNCFEKIVFLFLFGVWAEVFRVFGAIFRGMDFKSAFCMSRKKFWGEVFFGITLSADTFQLWAQFFQGFGEKKL